MLVILWQGVPLLATIRAEAQTILITERIDRKAENDCIENGKLKIYLLPLNIEDVILVQIDQVVIFLT